MIVDTSAIIAVFRGEAGWERYAAALQSAEAAKLSAAGYLESAIVIDRNRGHDPRLAHDLDEIIDGFEVDIVSVTAAQARIARQAYRDFGKGSGHPAQLNFGDCFAYALAAETGEALLYSVSSGNDFRHTGVRSALDEGPPRASG